MDNNTFWFSIFTSGFLTIVLITVFSMKYYDNKNEHIVTMTKKTSDPVISACALDLSHILAPICIAHILKSK